MKKHNTNHILFLFIIFIIIACNKINNSINGDQAKTEESGTSSLKIITSDSYLISVIQDNQMNQCEKARILLNEDLLSSNVCNELLSKSSVYDEYIIEVALASQMKLEDQVLINLIEKVDINDATVKSILQSKSPLSGSVKSKLTSVRADINKCLKVAKTK